MPIITPSSPAPGPASSIDLIAAILDANVNDDPGTLARYLHLWCTVHPSLGDRFMVPGGDVIALSHALGSIYKAHGLLIPSIECRDVDGRVWIGFRGDANPKARRCAMIRTSVYRGTFVSAGWEEGLARLKEEGAAADEVARRVDIATCDLSVPDGDAFGIQTPGRCMVRKGETSALRAADVSREETRATGTLRQLRTLHRETGGILSAVDDGAKRLDAATAGFSANTETRGGEPLVGGEWTVVEVDGDGDEEDEWMEI